MICENCLQYYIKNCNCMFSGTKHIGKYNDCIFFIQEEPYVRCRKKRLTGLFICSEHNRTEQKDLDKIFNLD